jgi:hypothetical protein
MTALLLTALRLAVVVMGVLTVWFGAGVLVVLALRGFMRRNEP